jgi:hypothetical protein
MIICLDHWREALVGSSFYLGETTWRVMPPRLLAGEPDMVMDALMSTDAPARCPGPLPRQPVRIVDGRFEGGYTDVFEPVCPGCCDHPYLDYPEIPPRLQLRGPRPLEAALAACDKHLGRGGREPDDRKRGKAALRTAGQVGLFSSHPDRTAWVAQPIGGKRRCRKG